MNGANYPGMRLDAEWFLSLLDERRAKAMRLLSVGKTFKEIGLEFGVTASRARQICMGAIRTIRRMARDEYEPILHTPPPLEQSGEKNIECGFVGLEPESLANYYVEGRELVHKSFNGLKKVKTEAGPMFVCEGRGVIVHGGACYAVQSLPLRLNRGDRLSGKRTCGSWTQRTFLSGKHAIEEMWPSSAAWLRGYIPWSDVGLCGD